MTRSLYSGVTTAAASVTVYWAGTTTKPTIYVSATGAAKSNPITADWLGAYSFWIDDGHYKIVNGSVAGDLNDVRVSSTVEAEPGADRISVLPFLGSTQTTQQGINEGLIAGTLSLSGGTFTGPVTTTDATNSTSITTGSIITAGGIGATKALWVGGLANIAGVATLANATDSSSSTTGGTIITGGAGIAKKLYVGTTANIGGVLTAADATASTSTATGSIVSAGGLGVAKDSFFGGILEEITANGSACILASASELLTLSTSGTTTDTTANLLPADAIILAVTGRVTTTITTATDWKLGDPTSAGRFSAVNATMTAGSTSVGMLQMAGDVATVALGPTQAAAAKVRVTTTGTPGAGAIRITVWYLQFVAPTS